MTEENKNNEVPTNDEANVEQAEPKKKSGLIKYIIFGVAGIAIIAIIAFGTAMFLKDDVTTKVQNSGGEIVAAKDGETKKTEQTEAEAQEAEKSETTHNEETSEQAHKQESPKANEHKAEQKSQTTENETNHAEKPAETHQIDEPTTDQYALSEEEQSAIDKIMDNLEFLDYQPAEGELPVDEAALTVEDSVKEVNWIKEEKARLEKWDKELSTREKELNKLQTIVDAKLAKLDQAETSRISQLAKLYDGMDARAVAQLLMNLDDDTVVSIIPRMKTQQASAVLQLIPSQRAARLSKQLITIAEN